MRGPRGTFSSRMPLRKRHLVAAFGLSLAGVLGALAWPARAGGAEACRAPEIRIYKREGALDLLCDGALRRTMPATFGAAAALTWPGAHAGMRRPCP